MDNRSQETVFLMLNLPYWTWTDVPESDSI